jgi:hypothetical protein
MHGYRAALLAREAGQEWAAGSVAGRRHLWHLYLVCRATLPVLSDDGEILPGQRIYNSLWIRDSAVEGIACALAGTRGARDLQFSEHYLRPGVFRTDGRHLGPNGQMSAFGFTDEEHDEHGEEWDASGQAL